MARDSALWLYNKALSYQQTVDLDELIDPRIRIWIRHSEVTVELSCAHDCSYM